MTLVKSIYKKRDLRVDKETTANFRDHFSKKIHVKNKKLLNTTIYNVNFGPWPSPKCCIFAKTEKGHFLFNST
jgi:hypothetical protein